MDKATELKRAKRTLAARATDVAEEAQRVADASPDPVLADMARNLAAAARRYVATAFGLDV